ncbi:MAG TPA: FAD-dependent oxidoreductase [Polyangia bacterium]|jgi:NADH dehydrogenase|nr:FAD-dependent oxidoreductase [Polyangia bacterium]
MSTSTRNLVVIGSGFAGVWAALAAARQRRRLGLSADIAITIVSPQDYLGIRPRFYEAAFAEAKVALAPLLARAGVGHVRAKVVAIDQARRVLELDSGRLRYDALVCAAGSATTRPSLPGGELMHDVDSFAGAEKTERHLRTLAAAPQPAPAAATVVIIGGGFTGIEAAAEMMTRLKALFGGRVAPRVILVERAAHIGPDFGPNARAVIATALAQLGVETRPATSVRAIAPDVVTLSTGESLAAQTVLWTAGVHASPLTRLLAPAADAHGRVAVDATLRLPNDAPIWVAGDCAHALVDGKQPSMMSCQHATPQGKYAGHNALSWLAGRRPQPYEQHLYLTCLDIGEWGALITMGFAHDRIIARGLEARPFKRFINETLIYPPAGDDAESLLRAAKPPAGGRLAAALFGRVLASPTLRALVLSRAKKTAARPAPTRVPSPRSAVEPARKSA